MPGYGSKSIYAVGASGLPVTKFSDTFVRANGDFGDNWWGMMRWNGSANNATTWPQGTVTNNRAHFTAAGTNIGAQLPSGLWIPRQLINTSTSGLFTGIYGVNQFCEMRFQAISVDNACRIGPAILAMGGMGGSVNEWQSYTWAVRFSGAAFAAIDLLKLVGGQGEAGNTFTVLGSDLVAPIANDILRISISGISAGAASVTLTCTKNGVQRLQVVDNTPLPFKGYPAMSLVTSLSTAVPGYDFDNFNSGKV